MDSTPSDWTAAKACPDCGAPFVHDGCYLLLALYHRHLGIHFVVGKRRPDATFLTGGRKPVRFVRRAFATVAGTFAIIMLIAIAVAIAAVFAFFLNCLSMLGKG